MTKLVNSDYYLDIVECLSYWQKSLNVNIKEHEIGELSDLKELTHLVVSKLTNEDSNTDTYSIVLEKLRKVFFEVGLSKNMEIKGITLLSSLMPWSKRKKVENLLLEQLNIDIQIVSPSCFCVLFWLVLGICSFILLFAYLELGLIGLPLSAVMIYLNMKLGRSLNYRTIDDLIRDILETNYLKIRGDGTVNYIELEELIFISLSETVNMAEEHTVTPKNK